MRPWDVSRNARLLARAKLAAIQRYGLDSCIVGLDIYNIEAEAYGSEIRDSGDDGVPSAGEPVFSGPNELLNIELDLENGGRVPLVFEAA